MAAVCAGLMSLMSGCQSNAQFDQVARELRMQEDELYALEDYLNQYQQLVCKYRTENAALKRQLADRGARPATSPRTDATTPDEPVDTTPSNDTTPADIQDPGVPPLQQTLPDSSNSNGRRQRGRVTPASAEGERQSLAARALALEAVDQSPPATEVWLHGEIVANETGGGPRMIVEVEPLDAEGRTTEFDGVLSLMLTAPGDDGRDVNVARWDYKPVEVHAATDAATGTNAIRFFLELPADSAATEAKKLWVRLFSRRTGRLVADSAIDLSQPSLFSSRDGMTSSANSMVSSHEESPVVTASFAEHDGDVEQVAVEEVAAEEDGDTGESREVAAISTGMFDGGWTIAKPGKPAGLPEAEEHAASEWRASSEPPPEVTSTEVAVREKPRVSRPREAIIPQLEPAPQTLTRRTWSPERSGESAPRGSRTAGRRPSWSATR